MNAELKASIMILAVQDLFLKNYFNICAVDTILEAQGASQKKGSEVYKNLHMLHCVHWSAMGPEMATQVKQLVCEMLLDTSWQEFSKAVGAKPAAAPQKSPEVIDVPMLENKPTLMDSVRRLLGN